MVVVWWWCNNCNNHFGSGFIMVQHNSSLRDIIKEEYVKCAANPVYFMKKYGKIQHPIRGKILFELWDFQEDVLRDFQDKRYKKKERNLLSRLYPRYPSEIRLPKSFRSFNLRCKRLVTLLVFPGLMF